MSDAFGITLLRVSGVAHDLDIYGNSRLSQKFGMMMNTNVTLSPMGLDHKVISPGLNFYVAKALYWPLRDVGNPLREIL